MNEIQLSPDRVATDHNWSVNKQSGERPQLVKSGDHRYNQLLICFIIFSYDKN